MNLQSKLALDTSWVGGRVAGAHSCFPTGTSSPRANIVMAFGVGRDRYGIHITSILLCIILDDP